MTTRRSLGSTYRLQLNGLGFAGARALVPYLDRLGIETLYLSPVLAAAPGSSHGYDVIDPGRLDPALGSPEQFEELLDELGAHTMRALIDIVPNHMSTDPSNRWWWDTLRRGQASLHARIFDIDWSQHGGRVLTPVLSRPLAVLRAEASILREQDGALLELDGQRFPLAPDDTAGVPLPDLLARQHFRPAFWRLGDTAGNYRRFFNIDGLAGVRVEDPEVFAPTHALILRLCEDERIAGLRVDHIDGLWDPADYLTRLGDALGPRRRRVVLLVEKILNRAEEVDRRWNADGTTGYEFGDRAGGLFLKEAGCRELSALGSSIGGAAAPFEVLALAAKREMLERTFVAQLDRLARMALSALDADHPGHDLAVSAVRLALGELTIHLDVYRTYLDEKTPAHADVATIERAVAQLRSDTTEREIGRAIELVASGLLDARGGNPWLDVARRWQQLTGAVMAKGVEDTATYRYDGLLSHAEVGCDPDRASCDVEDFHRFIRRRRRNAAGGLNGTSTHDSKRNEDARCRLAVLSEASDEWGRLVRRWHRRFTTTAPNGCPQPHDELVAYQTILSLWPPGGNSLTARDLRRTQDYAVKAAREAKRQTSWTDPDPRYERRLTSFVARACHEKRFRVEMGRFVRGIAPAAATNSLALLVLKACTPGVPDFYQGTELFEAALTDPDNRRTVDFSARAALLESLPPPGSSESTLTPGAEQMLASWQSGHIKLYVTRQLLHLRRQFPEVFAEGSYVPLAPSGSRAANLVAWTRRRGRHWVVALIPRLTLEHAGRGRFPIGSRIWSDTTCLLPTAAPRSYTDLFTGRVVSALRGRIQVASVFEPLPIAVLQATG